MSEWRVIRGTAFIAAILCHSSALAQEALPSVLPPPTAETSPAQAAPVRKAAQSPFIITKDELEKKVAEALVLAGAGEKLGVTIIGRREGEFFGHDKAFITELTGLTYDKATSKFTSRVLFLSGDAVAGQANLSGRYEALVSIPVLKQRVSKGVVITDADVEMVEIPASRMHSDVVKTAEDLVGRAPSRTISPKRPIRLLEVENPGKVKKNDIVIMQFRTATVEIKDSGTALADGAVGDVIPVRNLKSNLVVRGVVTGPGVVSVSPHDAGRAQ